MASLVLGVAGAAALGPMGLAWGGAFGLTGAQIGFMAGSMLGSSLTKLPDIQGPRMGDLKVQASTYGAPIPIYYGTARGAGQVIWSSDLIETEHEEDAGGKGGPSQSVSTYTYSVNCAVAVCAGEISGIRRIWANGNLILDQSASNTGPTGQSNNIRVYTGSETQVADSLLESYLGAGNVPAHRGLAYVVFENLQLEKYGNRIPNFSFEVVADGAVATVSNTQLSTSGLIVDSMMHPYIDGLVLSVAPDNGDSEPFVLHITDAISKTDREINVGTIPASKGGGKICHVKVVVNKIVLLDEIWVSTDAIDYGYSSDIATAFDTATLAFSRMITPAAGPNMNKAAGNMIFDKNFNKVLFATDGSTITAGYNALDPLTLLWDGVDNTDMLNDWYTGHGIAGDNSVALSNYGGYVCIFVDGQYVHSQNTTVNAPYLAYDPLRERYAWWDRNASSKSVFRVIDDSGSFEMTEYTPDTGSISSFGALNYFAIADKYMLSDTDNLYLLNADTFEVEDTWSIFPSTGSIYESHEIPGMPEYTVSNVSSTTGMALVPLTDRLSANTVTLSSIVTDICERVGLAAGDIDVTGLTDEVEGYTIAQQMTARAAIDGLQAAFYFDAVESD